MAPPLHHGPSVPPAVIPLPPGTHLLFAQTGKIERIPLEGGSMKKAEAKALLHAPVSAASEPGGASGPSQTPPRGARPGPLCRPQPPRLSGRIPLPPCQHLLCSGFQQPSSRRRSSVSPWLRFEFLQWLVMSASSHVCVDVR